MVQQSQLPQASASLPHLDGWVDVTAPTPGAELIRAVENPRPGDFRPNVVLTSTASSAPIESASSVSIAAILATHPGAQIISVDLWTAQPALGRRITASYPAGASQIVIERWVWADGTRHVQLSASAATHQFLASEPAFLFWATHLALTTEPGQTRRDPEADPARDEWASARTELPLELLERIVPRQPFALPPLVLSETAQRGLLAAAGNVLPRGSAAADELRAAGLLHGGRRQLSPFASLLAQHWQPAATVLEASRSHAGVTQTMTLWTLGTSTAFAVDVLENDAADAADAGSTLGARRACGVIPIAQTVDTVLRFLQIGPAWSFAVEPSLLSVADYEQRLSLGDASAAQTAPEGANDAFTHFWGEPWTELRVRSATQAARLVSGGAAGLLSLAAAPSGETGEPMLVVEALPSHAAYTWLLQMFESALAA